MEAISNQGEPAGGGISPVFPLGALVLATLAMGGMVGMGVVPVPTSSSRRIRHKRFMRSGLVAADLAQWERASRYYKKATRAKRDDPVAWFNWANMELEAGRLDNADRIARLAEDIPGSDRTDLLDLRASAAWQKGDLPAFEELLGDLAKETPGMARVLIEELEIDPSVLTPRMRERFSGSGMGGGMDGYV